MPNETHETRETTETTVEKPVLSDPAEEKRVTVTEPVEKTSEKTFEKRTETP